MNRPETWPAWQPQPGTQNPGHGGMSQLAAYDAGLTSDPGCWVQPARLHRNPRLDPQSPEYDPGYADRVAWEEPSPAEYQAQAEPHQPDPGPQPGPQAGPEAGPEADTEPELPF